MENNKAIAGAHPIDDERALEHALAFVKFLAGSTEAEVCLRTFPDNAARGDWLTRKLNGSLQRFVAGLRQLNQQGAGVFMVVNDGGQTKAEITRIRAVFADTDGAPLAPLLTLEPHLVIESSPGKWHVYWLVAADFPLEKFGPVQRAIADKFGTDPAVHDLPRVMRLPGFYHCKAEPFMVKVTQHNKDLPRYTLAQVVGGLGLQIDSPGEHVKFDLSRPPAFARMISRGNLSDISSAAPEHSLAEVTEMLRFINPGCRRETWRNVGFAIADAFGESGRDLFIRWSAGELLQDGQR
jgi:hypothetical protein